MRPVLVSLVCSLLMAGCVTPVQPLAAPEQQIEDRSVSVGLNAEILKAGQRLEAGSGNVIAAGAGNVIANGAGNVVANGAGNVIANGAGNVIANGAGNVLPTTGVTEKETTASVIAAGAGNLAPTAEMSLALAVQKQPEGGGLDSLVGCSTLTEPATGTLKGRLLAPGVLASAAGTVLPVQGATVMLYDLAGQRLGTATSGAEGAFELEGVPQQRVVVVRAAFTVAEATYYLGGLAKLQASEGEVTIDAVSTLLEAKFFAKAAGVLPDDAVFTDGQLTTLSAGVRGIKPDVALSLLQTTATFAQRSSRYDELALAHPAAFTGGIDGWTFTPKAQAADCTQDAAEII